MTWTEAGVPGVKNIIHDITSRLELRNRTHAVAYAIKAGVI